MRQAGPRGFHSDVSACFGNFKLGGGKQQQMHCICNPEWKLFRSKDVASLNTRIICNEGDQTGLKWRIWC